MSQFNVLGGSLDGSNRPPPPPPPLNNEVTYDGMSAWLHRLPSGSVEVYQWWVDHWRHVGTMEAQEFAEKARENPQWPSPNSS